MMFCIQCGNKLPDNAMFCNACGAATKPVQPSTGPTPPARITTQFGQSGQAVPPYSNSGPHVPVGQFGPAQSGSSPTVSAVPPTQMAAMPFESNPNNPAYHAAQTGPYPFHTGQQIPPTQRVSTQFIGPPGNLPISPTHLPSMPPNNATPPSPMHPGPYLTEGMPGDQHAQTVFANAYPPYESTHYSSDPFAHPWQEAYSTTASAAPPVPPPPPAGFQQWLIRTVGPNVASNAIFGVSLGGFLAAVIGAFAAILIVAIAHAIAPHITLYGGSTTGEDVVDYALGLIPLHNGFRDGLQLLLIMHGVGNHVQSGSDAFASTSPLNGFLIIPAVALTLGGYVAAGTDVRNRVSSSLWRGVAIIIPYIILLFIMTTQVNGCMPNNAGDLCSTASTSNSQLTMDTTSLLIFSILWGALFGLLGASIKLARGQWRHRLHQFLRSNKRPQIVGALTGSLAAIASGIVLSFLVVACFISYTSYSLLLLAHIPNYVTGPANGDWASMTLWTLSWGLLYGTNLFFFSMNAPVSFTNTNNTAHISISLFGSTPQISPWFHLLLAIPVICLFLGGRISAALGRVQNTGAAALQGAFVAIPFTILTMLLTPLSTITYSYQPGTTASSAGFIDTAGTGAFDVFIWALLAGAVLGALGGIYQSSNIKITVGQILMLLASLPILLSKPGYTLFARLSKQPEALEHTSTKNWLFTMLLVSALFLVGAGIEGGILIALNQTLTIDQTERIRDITSVILIAVTGLLVVCTCAAALRRDPVPKGVESSGLVHPSSPYSEHQLPYYPQQTGQPPYSQL